MKPYKEWIGLAMYAEEHCEYKCIVEIPDGESVQEAKERIIFSGFGWNCKPDEVDPDDREWENKRWDTFIFHNLYDIERLNNISLPNYYDDSMTAAAETMHCVYTAFAERCILGDSDNVI